MDFIMNNLEGIYVAISSIVTAASAICALWPSNSANRLCEKLRRFLEILALNVGQAKTKNA